MPNHSGPPHLEVVGDSRSTANEIPDLLTVRAFLTAMGKLTGAIRWLAVAVAISIGATILTAWLVWYTRPAFDLLAELRLDVMTVMRRAGFDCEAEDAEEKIEAVRLILARARLEALQLKERIG